MPFARAALAVALLEQGDISNALIQYNCAVLLDSRYGDPDALAIDIRWKPKSREVLERVKILSENKQE